LPALGDPERPSIDHPVRPAKSQAAELAGEVLHRMASIELQHEGHVLEQEPAWIGGLEEPEDVAYEAGSAAPDAEGTPGLAEVLAREPGCDEVDVGKGTQVAYVSGELDAGETGTEYRSSAGLDLVEEH
jgi:hypothetical protein